MDERNRFLVEHAEHPQAPEWETAARRSESRLAELLEELIQWSGAEPVEFFALYGEVVQALYDERETAAP